MRHRFRTLCLILLAGAVWAESLAAEPSAELDFDRQIAPLIAQRCLGCHRGSEPKGKLDLSSHDSALAGGESGPAIVPGQLDESLLWEYIDSDEMPPKKPLLDEEKLLLKTWIASGAKWGTDKIDPFRFTTDARAGYDWWSLKPLAKPEPTDIVFPGWERNPIDTSIGKRLREAGLVPSAAADKPTLIRRLSFDLLGLPPTPEQIKEFLADTSNRAYDKLVDRLLASPHYGERWARHWLDVVRFGESNGFEYDQPRDNAWHYRNWVIDALNEDLPYDEFVRLQLAGDVLRPDDPQSIAAVGFLVAGAHNTTLPASDKMRMSMAQDELEDLVGVVGQTFLGLTVHCARCHDHKFDPISQKEYYQLAATLTGVGHGERSIRNSPTPERQLRIVAIDARLAAIRNELEEIERPLREKILAERKTGLAPGPEPPPALATWEFDTDLLNSQQTLSATAHGGARLEDGFLVLDGKGAYVSTEPLRFALEEKTLEAWVQLDNLDQRGGGAISLQTLEGVTFDAIVFGEREPKRWMAGSNGFVRTQPFGGSEETNAVDRPVHLAIIYQHDGTITAYREGRPYGKPYRSRELNRFAAGSAQIIFGLRHSPASGNRLLAGRILRAQLYDRALTPDEVAASAGVADSGYVANAELLARLPIDKRALHERLNVEVVRLQSEQSLLADSEPQKLYTCVSRDPGVTRLLRRGNVADPAEEVSPSGLAAVAGVDPDFQLAPNAPDSERRRKLAAWITHRDNPLFARVLVNRLWHYHFGQGLVTTPSDFGYNGGQPSHPELLEWLAATFRDGGYRLKPLHRLIVTSATYRQRSAPNAEAAQIDADNRWLWRKTPQRLEAEAIRDAALVITGQLNAEIGGKGYRDVRHFAFKGSNFYEPLDESGPETHRRTIYRFSPRGGRNPFLDTFDCPDPSATAPQRAMTTTPLQALVLMNNALIFQIADDFSTRVKREAGDDAGEQIELAYLLAYGRTASVSEVRRASRFAAEHGLPSLCRVILNSNEFLYVQ